jgi:hypothetical protein
VRASSRERGQILILLGMWLFFGGGASSALVVYARSAKETKKEVKRVVADADRRDAILSAISQWESGQKNQDKWVSEYRDDLLKILRRKDAQRSEAEPVMARLDVRLAETDRNFLDLRFRVKEHATSKEWAALAAPPVSYGAPASQPAPTPTNTGH